MTPRTPGRFTIPSEEDFADETARLARLWGADAIRNSDGTRLDDAVVDLGLAVYGAYFPVRGDNAFIREHLEERPQMFLQSDRVLARTAEISLGYADGYFAQQLEPNRDEEALPYWEVVDRTTGALVPREQWTLSADGSAVVLTGAELWHEYTVAFLAYVAWDPVEMYNHLTNGWGDREHEIPYDPRHPATAAHLRSAMTRWLEENPKVDVVRFTTFFYQFSLVFDEQGREKFVDWFGYGATVSPRALRDFESEKGFALRAEDFVDEGYYNSSFRVPSENYRAWTAFVRAFVQSTAAELVAQVKADGREAMMFLGDQWIGMEPYSEGFADIGLDAVVGSVGDGTTLRMISDIPGLRYTEGRFLPYFFPDTFYEGNDPRDEALDNWLQARRAILRSPIDRMGYGGYLSLAAKAPEFVRTVEEIAEEFRGLHERIAGTAPRSSLVVAVLNHWGALRSWQAFTVAHALHSKQAYSYYGVLEALSGMPVEVRFLSFDDVLERGIDADIDVIITAGAADTAFSGGDVWRKPELVARLRSWVDAGGGLVGVGEPTATSHQGRFFQLADCFGVDRERGFSLSSDKHDWSVTGEHFITEGIDLGSFSFGEPLPDVYAISPETEILHLSDSRDVHLSAHASGGGRAVYATGLPYSPIAARLLSRALHWAAGKEEELDRFTSSNPVCEVNVYPDSGVYCVVNNTRDPQSTTVVLEDGTTVPLDIEAAGLVWKELR
ncbi:1,3-beta-galactosyl-N-acetylhexosamine phosphorylase [Rathayibacter sp. Leaf248]|uniref:1,3-beta-galactosyl-N-acetylhexosamine phosphorylase n=1 Tax=Rathayibacter sp. Leaf248 TaxID=2876555 RepID=UPI001E4C0E04|nr:1,3-beta-galactosyl-N-acetylhexosamine phosphorylase [Rathayibacter sp. Leaf248]